MLWMVSLKGSCGPTSRRVAGTPWSISPFIRRWSACTVRSAMLSTRVPQLVIGPRSCWTKDFVLCEGLAWHYPVTEVEHPPANRYQKKHENVVAPRAGLEPATNRLTADRSTN